MKESAPESSLVIPTSWGNIRVWAREGRVVRCQVPLVHERPPHALRLQGRPRLSDQGVNRKVLQQAGRFVADCLAGRAGVCPPLCDDARGSFTRRARMALRKIPLGVTIAYAELAQAAGAPGAARAAGTACATNPLPLFIPCHRVLATGGKLGGFSGGLAWKVALLEREKAVPVAVRRSS